MRNLKTGQRLKADLDSLSMTAEPFKSANLSCLARSLCGVTGRNCPLYSPV
jgi:hypothetical protein